ncbi:tail protein [Caudoviricetes sp.]|nr:tail protein [Caudoviricetes sp.]
MTTYTNPYTGQTVSPSQVGYEQLTIATDTVLQWPINGNTDSVVANIIEISATASSLKVFMPPATQVSNGQSTLVRNIGSNSFTVVDTDGNTIVAIASGIAEYIYVTDNSTIDGTWETVTFGAGTSAANAATLAGYGLKAISTTLNTQIATSLFSSDYIFTPQDRASLYVWGGGAGTVTLPSAADVGAGWYVVIKNDGTGILDVALTGTNTIDGQSSAQLQIAESFVVVSTGTNYVSYAYGQSAQFFFTQLVKNVTGGTVTLTQPEASNIIQEYQGVLTSNCTVIVPPTVQLYSFRNNTSGAYSLTFSTGAGGGALTLTLPQNQTIIAICDGTNIYNAQTSTSSFINALTLGNGSAAAPSLSFTGDALTGLYLAASHQLGFAINGLAAGQLTPSGLLLPVGINGGAF